MLGIVRKDYLLFALATLVVFPAILLVESVTSTELRSALMVTNMALAWLLAFGPLMATEMEEEHSNGYVLLGSLPVRAREIVAAKFSLFLGAVAVCTAGQFATVSAGRIAPELLTIAQSAALLSGTLCLLLGGFAYAGIFIMGCARFGYFSMLVSLTATVVAPFIFRQPGPQKLLRDALRCLLSMNGSQVILAGLALYVLLFFVSVAFFRFEPRKRVLPLL